jgi:SAM-dependent methyltransferase
MQKQDFENYLRQNIETPFSGWDFSYLQGKMLESPLPWDYRQLVESYLASAGSLLDMGTGGGEFLDSLAALPAVTFATEGYLPNLGLAQARLAQRGVQVRQVLADNLLPFEDSTFDLVINRHEEYDPAQVWRVLKPGGHFITQQVGGLNDLDLNAMLGAPPPEYFDWCLFKTSQDLLGLGFRLLHSKQVNGWTRFTDCGSLVYYLKCIPWQIADFSIERYLDRLTLANAYIETHGFIEFVSQRFYLVAQKPANIPVSKS